MEEQEKIKPETDDLLQEGPELENVMHEVELNQCTTSGEINSKSSVAKAYRIERSSLKLVCGCLHRVWKCENEQAARVLMVVPKVRILEVLKVLLN